MRLINLIKYIILGIIQGFTEPIPISSSGHLLIIKKLFKLNTFNDINFEIIVNFGSFLAILFLYRKKILELIKGFFNYLITKKSVYKENYKYSLLIIFGTIPAGIFGLLFKDNIDKISNNIKLIGLALLITSFALFIIKDLEGYKDKIKITFCDSIIIGLFQAIALLPGISRSGATITGAMFRNLTKKEAADFSFMLYLPISLVAFMLSIKDLLNVTNINTLILPYILGLIASMVTTYFSAKWFINIIKKGKLIYFSIYCLIAGLLVIVFI